MKPPDRKSTSPRQPVYSPDGKWIAFRSTRHGTSDLYVRHAEPSLEAAIAEPSGRRAHRWRDLEPLTVAPRPRAHRRRCGSLRDRVMDPAHRRLAVADERDHDGEDRLARGEIRRAVDRVDEPDRRIAGKRIEHRGIGSDGFLADDA